MSALDLFASHLFLDNVMIIFFCRDCCATEELRHRISELSKQAKKAPIKRQKHSINYEDSRVVVLLKRNDNPDISFMEVAARCRPFMEFSDTMTSNVNHVLVPEKTCVMANIDILIAILRNIHIITYQCKYVCHTIEPKSMALIKTSHYRLFEHPRDRWSTPLLDLCFFSVYVYCCFFNYPIYEKN